MVIPLPDQGAAKDTFHVYKDQLMQFPVRELPRQLEVDNLDHFRVLSAVLMNHPRAAAKIGEGIGGLFVRRSLIKDGVDVCCCFVRRVDGSEEDFSIFVPYKNRSWKDDGHRFDANTDALYKREI
jgi:hypothetical protein